MYRLNYLNARFTKPRHPIDVTLELSSRCNLRCSYCFHADKVKPFAVKDVDTETALDIIRSAHDCGVNSLKFNWRGESLLHRDYYQIVNYANSRAEGSIFIDRIVNTNFSCIVTDDVIDALSRVTKVKVSLDSFWPEVMEVQRSGSYLNRIKNNIDRLYFTKDRQCEIVIQAVRTKLNYYEDIESEARGRWPGVKVSIRDMVGGRNTSCLGDIGVRDRGSNRILCRQAFARLIFDAEGNAHPCCPDIKNSVIFGNIKDQSVSDIWLGKPRAEFLERLKSGEEFNREPCKSCSSFESYAGYKPGFWS